MRSAVLVALVAGLAGLSLGAAQPRPTAPSPDLTLVDVVVERGDGRVPNLSAKDFEVTSDGQPRRIEYFSQDERPLTVVLLVDVTVSAWVDNSEAFQIVNSVVLGVRDKRVERLIDAFTGLLAPGDRGLVGGIAGRVVLGRRFTSDKAELAATARETLGVPGVETFGPSPIWDSIDAVVAILAREPGRRALIVRTDGMATGNLLSVKDAAARARAAGVSVNMLAAGEEDKMRGISPRNALEWIAGETGGSFVLDRGNPKPQLIQMFSGLRYAYTLGFAGDRDGKPHALEVRLKKSGPRLRFRKSYGG
jgi:Ca-activated chloride channel family protein